MGEYPQRHTRNGTSHCIPIPLILPSGKEHHVAHVVKSMWKVLLTTGRAVLPTPARPPALAPGFRNGVVVGVGWSEASLSLDRPSRLIADSLFAVAAVRSILQFLVVFFCSFCEAIFLNVPNCFRRLKERERAFRVRQALGSCPPRPGEVCIRSHREMLVIIDCMERKRCGSVFVLAHFCGLVM